IALAPARAAMPPLPLPAWVQVDLALDHAPALGGTATVRLKLTALLARLEGVKWEVTLPPQLVVASGARAGTLALEVGKPFQTTLVVRAQEPCEGRAVAAEVKT